jgi:hypothetical protein
MTNSTNRLVGRSPFLQENKNEFNLKNYKIKFTFFHVHVSQKNILCYFACLIVIETFLFYEFKG